MVWSHLVSIEFKDFENIKRWYDWLEALNQIYWSKICGKEDNKANKNIERTTQKMLTGSQDLIDAVWKGNHKKARAILTANPLAISSFDMKKNRLGLAHIASHKNDLEMLKLLVEFNVDLEFGDKEGKTPVYFAAEHEDQAMVEYLIGQGVDLDPRKFKDRSPVYWAANHGRVPTLKALIDAGANPDRKSIYGKSALGKA